MIARLVGHEGTARAALLAIAVLLGAGLAGATEVVNLWQLPEVAQETVEAQVGEGTVYEIDRDDDGGRITYTVTYTTPDGDGYVLTIDQSGFIIANVEA